LLHYALERLQVRFDGEHESNPLLCPLVLKNREALVAQVCRFKLKDIDGGS